MKKIKFSIIVLITVLFNSCYDFNVAPYDTIAQGNFWKTEKDAKEGAMAVYAQLKMIGAYGYMPLWDTYSDIAHGPGGPVELGTLTADYSFLVSNWKDTYEGVHRANNVIKNVQSMDIPDSVKSSIVGEAYFLRALYYFHLVDLFGGVPIYDEKWDVAETFNKMNLPRSSAETVWAFIISDLNKAVTALPLAWSADNYGRATKGAAYALRGKAYLYTKDWKNAIADFEEIVYNKSYNYNYNLFSNYSTLFTSAGPIPGDKETIFAIQNKGDLGALYGMRLARIYGTRGAYGGGQCTCMPTITMADMYEYKDGKPFNWNNHITGFNENDAIKKSTFWATLNSSKTAILSKPDTALLGNIYRGRDPRLNQSVIVPYSRFKGYVGTADKIQLYVVTDGATETNGFLRPGRAWWPYAYRKFVPIGNMGGAITSRDHTPINFPIIRLADVILMLSEAFNEDNQLDNAIKELNKVRARTSTNMPALNSGAEWLNVSSKTEMTERIIRERAFELSGEGHRFSDLRRWKLAATLLNKTEKDLLGNLVFNRLFADRDYLWPIPSAEIQMNPSLLPNNPGW
ncbi:MAG: RagB/SusD family nutrient uptake outer membrane protein [Paludibacter sp.]|nr:RagB/SusD family nutrient uptake outer membrane protein [Paludibacter sp.]